MYRHSNFAYKIIVPMMSLLILTEHASGRLALAWQMCWGVTLNRTPVKLSPAGANS